MKTCAKLLIELLERYGIDTVFGIPGVHTVELYRYFSDSKLRHITPRHEQGAGFMADGYARASGKPAACFLISGPGVTNIVTAMGQAYADSVPMLVISSVNNRNELGRGEGRLHELPDQSKLMSGVSAFSHTLMKADDLPNVFKRAFDVFNSARPRPVHIEIPLDVMIEPVSLSGVRVGKEQCKPEPDPASVKQAIKLLQNAKKPIVVLGGGVQDAAVSALEFIDKLAAPVVTTINGKGIMPVDHPLCLGSSLSFSPVRNEMITADVVLAMGTELGETDTLLFNEQLTLEGKLIRIDIDAEQLTRNVAPEVSILSDSEMACRALTKQLGSVFQDNHRERFKNAVNRVKQLVEMRDASLSPIQQIHRQFLSKIKQTLPNVIIVGDSTQPIYSANLSYQSERTRSYFNSSTGFGTLGYALPAALGAKLAMSNRSVVAIIGDGGLQFTINEIACAVEFKIAVIILLWNNNGYAEIERYMLEQNIPPIGVDIYTPDFQIIGEGFGCHTSRVNSLAELEQQLQIAQRASGPSLIEIDETQAERW